MKDSYSGGKGAETGGEGTRGGSKRKNASGARRDARSPVSHDGGLQTGDEIKEKEKAHNVAGSSQLLRLNGFPREGNYYAVKASGRSCGDDGKNGTEEGRRGARRGSADTGQRGQRDERRKSKKSAERS